MIGALSLSLSLPLSLIPCLSWQQNLTSSSDGHPDRQEGVGNFGAGECPAGAPFLRGVGKTTGCFPKARSPLPGSVLVSRAPLGLSDTLAISWAVTLICHSSSCLLTEPDSVVEQDGSGTQNIHIFFKWLKESCNLNMKNDFSVYSSALFLSHLFTAVNCTRYRDEQEMPPTLGS